MCCCGNNALLSRSDARLSLWILTSLLCVKFWVTQKTLWNQIWAARAAGLKRQKCISFHFHVLMQSGHSRKKKNRFKQAVLWTRPKATLVCKLLDTRASAIIYCNLSYSFINCSGKKEIVLRVALVEKALELTLDLCWKHISPSLDTTFKGCDLTFVQS